MELSDVASFDSFTCGSPSGREKIAVDSTISHHFDRSFFGVLDPVGDPGMHHGIVHTHNRDSRHIVHMDGTIVAARD
ncbi:MAG: hypothetical protein IT447_14410 [Phycisphaerales bacterium]|nr:hypothetical protein [Phycisphaerales bacterium]